MLLRGQYIHLLDHVTADTRERKDSRLDVHKRKILIVAIQTTSDDERRNSWPTEEILPGFRHFTEYFFLAQNSSITNTISI